MSEAEVVSSEEIEWVQIHKSDKIVRMPHKTMRASRAPFMLEFWLIPGPPRSSLQLVRTLLWVNGEMMGPGGDMLIQECPSCDHLFLPPLKKFRPKPEWRIPRGVMLVYCPGCNMVVRQDQLVTNRTITAPPDIAARHLAFRFRQLEKRAVKLMEVDERLRMFVSTSSPVDALYRIMRAAPGQHIDDMLGGVSGAQDKLLAARIVNNEDCAYAFGDTVASELAKGVTLESYFKRFLSS